jgi:hypothetical protein
MDTYTIQIVDQVGSKSEKMELVVPTLILTTRELIHLRVHQAYTTAVLAFEK